MKKLLSLVLCFTLLYSIVAFGEPIKEQPSKQNNSLKSVDIPFGRSLLMRGVAVSEDINFEVDRFWDVRSAEVNLFYTRSSLQLPYKCTLTVLINGTPVFSKALSDKAEGNRELIKFPIKLEYLKKGINSVTLKMYMRVSDEICTDDINSGNWINFHSDSFIRYTVIEGANNSISNFPFPFLKASQLKSTDSVIMLPDKVQGSEATTAMLVEASLSKDSPKDVVTPIMKYSDVKRAESEIIYIGRVDNTPMEILNLLSNDQVKSAENKVILKLVNSPFNTNKRLLCIVSNNDALLERAGSFLLNTDLVSQAKGDYIELDEKVDVLTKKSVDIMKKSFEEMGYNDVALKGHSRQQYTMGVNLPKNRVVQRGSKVYIHFRYSKNLDFTKSLVTLYVNGKAMTSKKLTSEMADDDRLEFQIPALEANKYYYEFQIAFDLELKDLDCTRRYEEMPWALICKDSGIEFNFVNNSNYIFETYPSPFIFEGEFNDLLMILPQGANSKDLTEAGSIINLMAKDLNSNRGGFSLKFADGGDIDKNKNYIVIGTPQRNQAISKFNSNLWFSYNPDYTAFLSNEKKYLLAEYSTSIATLQIIKSPFNKDKAALVITAPKEELVSAASKYLSQSTLFPKLLGDSVIVERGGDTINHYFKGKDKIAEVDKTKLNLRGSDIKGLIVFLTLIIALFIFTFTLYFRKYRKR